MYQGDKFTECCIVIYSHISAGSPGSKKSKCFSYLFSVLWLWLLSVSQHMYVTMIKSWTLIIEKSWMIMPMIWESWIIYCQWFEKDINSLPQPRTDAPCPDPCGQLGSICGTLANWVGVEKHCKKVIFEQSKRKETIFFMENTLANWARGEKCCRNHLFSEYNERTYVHK